jgi:hypothetical protein
MSFRKTIFVNVNVTRNKYCLENIHNTLTPKQVLHAVIADLKHYLLVEKRLVASSRLTVCVCLRVSVCTSVHPPVRPSARNTSAATEGSFMKFVIGVFFQKSVEKIQVPIKFDKNRGRFT